MTPRAGASRADQWAACSLRRRFAGEAWPGPYEFEGRFGLTCPAHGRTLARLSSVKSSMKKSPKHWQLQEAKNKLSQVLKDAVSGGPQYITVHGKNTAVILSTQDYETLKGRRSKLASSLAVPILDDELATELFERNKDTGRGVTF